MMGRNHLLIALILVGANLWALNSLSYTSFSLVDSLLILAFVSIGSLLPDVDSEGKASAFNSKSKIPFLGQIRALISLVTLWLVYKPLQLILSVIGIVKPSAKELAGHRGIMHTLLGLLIVVGFWWLALSSIFAYLKLQFFFVLPLASLALGYFIHLLEDSHTRGGIKFMTGLLIPKKFIVNGSLITDSTGASSFYNSDSIAMLYYSAALVPVTALAFFGKVPVVYVLYATGASFLLALFVFNMKIVFD